MISVLPVCMGKMRVREQWSERERQRENAPLNQVFPDGPDEVQLWFPLIKRKAANLGSTNADMLAPQNLAA